MKKQILLFFTLLLASVVLKANNLVVTNAKQVSLNEISFNLSWENSWYVGGAPSNHDAAWIFIKYRECGGDGPYIHALLSTTMTDHHFDSQLTYATPISLNDRFGNVPAGATVANGLGNNTGCMVRRKAFGKGDITSALCTLKVVSTAATPFETGKDYEIKVIGIEMVFVRTEGYTAGDGELCTNSFKQLGITGEDAIPADALKAGQVALPLEYPKGYQGFYCMKYEITEGQFYDFMNAGAGLMSSPTDFTGLNRNNLTIGGTTTPDRAQNYMKWGDLTAYLDWAALRPITELEYEKSCKGSGTFSTQGYAWGTVSYRRVLYLSGTEDGTETAATIESNAHCYEEFTTVFNSTTPNGAVYCRQLNSNATRAKWGVSTHCDWAVPSFPTTETNWAYYYFTPIYMCGSDLSQGWGPVGAGLFARDATLSRETTGATYYGIMEMSGNVAEQCVDIASTGYKGTWGNGYLTSGVADVADWPATNAARCLRGGGYSLPATNMRVCDRQYKATTGNGDWGPTTDWWRKGVVGGRGAR